MWLNGINMNEVAVLACVYSSGGGGTYSLDALWPSSWSYAGVDSSNIKSYANPTDLATEVEAFVGAAGFPWFVIGTLPTSSSQSAVVAVNLSKVLSFTDSYPTPGYGVKFNLFNGAGLGPDTSNGYASWSDFSDAQAGLLALVGNQQA